MNKKHASIRLKAVALVCLLAMMIGTFSVLASAAEYVYDTPLEPEMWEDPNFDDPSSYAYSLAFVGDIQCLMLGDRLYKTNNVERLFKYVAGTAEERKLEQVFVLGDITETGYYNDYNIANMALGATPSSEEWEIAQNAIFQLNGKVNYSLCRGNHDDYMMEDFFNVPEYTDQFKGTGGFFSDTGATYPSGGRNKDLNPTGAIYWSAFTGVHEESIVNSWRTAQLGETKYLFVTVDYNPTEAVAEWVDALLTEYSDHKAIITTHSYILASGELISSESNGCKYPTSFAPERMWKKVYSKHENVFMIVCGHETGANVPIYTVNTGVNGNTVYQFLINPQTYDLKDGYYGTQDQGLVMYMNFSEDGKTISLNYYATLLDKFLKGANYTIDVSGVKEKGSIDMAGLDAFGQVTPVVEEQKKPTLNGAIEEGEYSAMKLTKKQDLAVGSTTADITEYYSYDDDYIYYAVKAEAPECSISLHLGDSLYYLDEINNSDLHSRKVTVSLKNKSCTQISNDGYGKIRNGEDMTCRTGTDADGLNVYELKISRDYLKGNGCPDNALSYTLSWGSNEHRFNISDEAMATLKAAGVEDTYEWTYNYAYFGTRPIPSEETEEEETTEPAVEETTEAPATKAPTTEAPEAEAPATTEAPVTEAPEAEVPATEAPTPEAPAEEKRGCGSTVSIAGLALITSLGACTVFVTSKKKN